MCDDYERLHRPCQVVVSHRLSCWCDCFTLRTISATSGVGQGKASLGVDHADHGQKGYCCQVRVPAHLCAFRKNINNKLTFQHQLLTTLFVLLL